MPNGPQTATKTANLTPSHPPKYASRGSGARQAVPLWGFLNSERNYQRAGAPIGVPKLLIFGQLTEPGHSKTFVLFCKILVAGSRVPEGPWPHDKKIRFVSESFNKPPR